MTGLVHQKIYLFERECHVEAAEGSQTALQTLQAKLAMQHPLLGCQKPCSATQMSLQARPWHQACSITVSLNRFNLFKEAGRSHD